MTRTAHRPGASAKHPSRLKHFLATGPSRFMTTARISRDRPRNIESPSTAEKQRERGSDSPRSDHREMSAAPCQLPTYGQPRPSRRSGPRTRGQRTCDLGDGLVLRSRRDGGREIEVPLQAVKMNGLGGDHQRANPDGSACGKREPGPDVLVNASTAEAAATHLEGGRAEGPTGDAPREARAGPRPTKPQMLAVETRKAKEAEPWDYTPGRFACQGQHPHILSKPGGDSHASTTGHPPKSHFQKKKRRTSQTGSQG
jgi:hypothetical protein